MPKFGSAERKIISDFHKLWHESIDGTWHKMRWLGVKALKPPTDLWVVQELIASIKPDWIIETGTCFGGSALFYATICEALRNGNVITVDIKLPKVVHAHPRLEYLTGSSVAPETIEYLKKKINGKVLVILDSDHRMDHVSKELVLYSPLVTKGSYLIVEDTDINRSTRLDHGPGPADAIDKFLKNNNRFKVDQDCERYYLTFHPGGYLRCVK